MGCFVLIMTAVILVDQLSKLWVVHHFVLYQSVPLIPGFFNFTYLTNTGAAFGILAGRPALWRQVFFLAIGLGALVIIALLQHRIGRRNPWYSAGLALIAGGALGNLIDRVRLGAVVDFLDFYVGSHHWPPFNVADSAITIGVLLLVFVNLFFHEEVT